MKQIITQQPQKPAATDKFQVGKDFEDYVIRLFNESNFLLLDRQPSEKLEDFRHLDINSPDLYLVFGRKRQYRFAVECKWRQRFNADGSIYWARLKQIESYLRYQRKFNIPVFVAIGIGGLPSAPEKLFVTPLYNISHNETVQEASLIPWKRKPTARFFYDTIQLKLF